MTKIIVDIPGEQAYDVRVGAGALDGLGSAVRTACAGGGSKALIVTDTVVAPLYLAQAKASLEQAGYTCATITVPSGETAKSIECASEVWHAMSQCRLGRDSVVVALGGGVVGDLAGFTGSTFMRGLRVVQAPTTLLSMVDSSVGGKTGINLETGKNLVGTFCQPRYVCADVNTLATLPRREWACGCAEIAKSSVIDSPDFYEWMCANAQKLQQRDVQTTHDAVVRSVVFKARVVAADKKETKGERESLNYGHTLAHAIETAAGYGVYSHGAAVAQGMRFAARLAAELAGASVDFVLQQDALLDELDLPALDFSARPEELLSLMKGDKKVRNGELRFVLPLAPGAWEVRVVSDEIVLEHLRAWQQGIERAKGQEDA